MFNVVHCFFEQSGTFKNAFKDLGYTSFDYDLKNDFNQTDFVLDLFDEIKCAANGLDSIFDGFGSDDLIFAFFPCVRFDCQILLSYTCNSFGMDKWDNKRKLCYNSRLIRELFDFYNILNSFVYICLDRHIPLIIENPYSSQSFLVRYWCFRPGIIDFDRRLNGDCFKKPTMFYNFNFDFKDNLVFESLPYIEPKLVEKCNTVERSLISPIYANRFIRRYLLESEV